MSPEIYWLLWSSVLTAMLWVPYGSFRISRIGFVRLLMDPLPGDDPFDKEWAHRAYRVHMNALESIATFAPVAIAVHITGTSNEITATCAMIYFFARLVYVPVYIFKVPIFRLLLFMVGLIATLTMAYQLIG